MRKIAFIVGQGGAGKTTLVDYFKKHPVKNWLFFDFDEGAKKKPNTKDLANLSKWVDVQRDYWVEDIRSEKYGDKNICLFGVGLFPWKVGNPTDISFGYLFLDQKLRKDRLYQRGDPHLWEAYQKDVSNIVRRLDEAGARKFDTHRPIEQTAQEIRDWLISL